jgi:hypothetical protein
LLSILHFRSNLFPLSLSAHQSETNCWATKKDLSSSSEEIKIIWSFICEAKASSSNR